MFTSTFTSTRTRALPLAALSVVGLALAACGSSSSSTTSAPSTSAPSSVAPSDPSSAPATATESSAPSSSAPAAGGPITVGAFGFGESKILANMYAIVLTKAGYQAEVKELTNREVVNPALVSNDIQVVPEYLATLTEFLNVAANGKDAKPLASGDVAATTAALRMLAEAKGLKVLDPSGAADQNAFAVKADFATTNKLTTLSDLATFSAGNPVTLGGPPECPKRPFCQPGLEKTYGMKFASFKPLDAGGPLTKQAIAQGQVTVGLVFSSDGGIGALGLTVLTDDKALQNADNIVPVVNAGAYSDALAAALDVVSKTLTTDDLVALNKSVDIDRQDPKKVAQEWLASKGLA